MALTIEQATAAGTLAARAIAIQTILTTAQAAVDGKAQISEVVVHASVGQLSTDVALSAADSATLLNTAVMIYQAMLADTMKQLEAIP